MADPSPAEMVGEALTSLGYQKAEPGRIVTLSFDQVATQSRLPRAVVRQVCADQAPQVLRALPSGWRFRIYLDRGIVELTRKGVSSLGTH